MGTIQCPGETLTQSPEFRGSAGIFQIPTHLCGGKESRTQTEFPGWSGGDFHQNAVPSARTRPD